MATTIENNIVSFWRVRTALGFAVFPFSFVFKPTYTGIAIRKVRNHIGRNTFQTCNDGNKNSTPRNVCRETCSCIIVVKINKKVIACRFRPSKVFFCFFYQHYLCLPFFKRLLLRAILCLAASCLDIFFGGLFLISQTRIKVNSLFRCQYWHSKGIRNETIQ